MSQSPLKKNDNMAFAAQDSIQTTCPYCGVGCGMEIKPKKNTNSAGNLESFEVKVIGQNDHPANFGRLCVKGSTAGETVNSEDRMLHPQINGAVVDWETALTDVAENFQSIVNEHGPDAVAFYVSGQFLTEDYYVANKLIKGFIGTANIDTNSRLCMASAVVGYKRAFGSDTVPCSYEDLETADLITIVGSNTAWAHPIVYQRIAAAKKARPDMKIVVVDPRRTATCDIADLFLPIKPGMDAALFNGLLASLAKNEATNTDYIRQFTEGFDVALEQAQKGQGDIVQVAEQCDLDVCDLETWFEWVTQTEKMVTLYSQGINQSSSGVDKSNAIINCHLATGRIGREGMGPFSITGQPNAMGGREVGGLANQLAAHMDFNKPEHIDLVKRFWEAPNMAQQNGLKAVDMFQAVSEGKIKAIWIMNTNPVVSMPDADAVKAALEKCEYVVVQDCIQKTDTTLVANVLLPSTTWGETDGAVTNSDRTISIQRQFMQGPENARPDWWILSEVAKRMGWKEAFDYQSAADIFREHAKLSGFENNGSRDFDISAFSEMTQVQYDNLEPVQWPVNNENPKGTKRMFSDGRFFTESGKAKFIAIQPREPQSQTSEDFPFVFNTGRIRDQWHTMTRTAKTAKLMTHKDEPYLTIHPEDAKKVGVSAGNLVRATNLLGTFIGRADLSDTQRSGEVFAPMHWTGQYASHGRVDALVAPFTDPLSGQPESKHSVVKLEPYHSKWQGFVLSRHAVAVEAMEYWVKIKGQKFYRYEMAGESVIDNPEIWSKNLLNFNDSQNWIEYIDQAKRHYRAAVLENGKLQGVVFLAPGHEMPSRHWLGELFKEPELDVPTRRSVLAGQACGAKDEGQTICTCFGVGINTIVEAIHEQKLTSVDAIGKSLKAGTNCGSCVPELRQILATELK